MPLCLIAANVEDIDFIRAVVDKIERLQVIGLPVPVSFTSLVIGSDLLELFQLQEAISNVNYQLALLNLMPW